MSLEKGYESVERIGKHIKRTNNIGTFNDFGNFGGLFDLSKFNMKEPVLVSGTDGVGTKLLLAQQANIHNTIGIDLVAMCVNDVLAVGARPLYFMDYIAVDKNRPQVIEQLVSGIADGCIQADCALIGGETAEMPDMYAEHHYDLAGYTTGVVEKSKILSKENVKPGYRVIGLESNGIHSNGYSLLRKIFFKDHACKLDDYITELNSNLKDELLKPTRIYVKGVINVLSKVDIAGIAHITGGGFIENIPRALPDSLGAIIDEKTIPTQPVFAMIERLGAVDHLEMYNIFNMGIGLVLILDEKSVEQALSILSEYEYNARVIGKVTNSKGVQIV